MIVVFDIGNVLLRWDPRNLYRKVFDDEARMERFLATALGKDFILQTDVDPDFSAAIEKQARAFPEFADEVRLYDTRWVETLGGPIEVNVALLRRLRADGRAVHALSNYSTAKFAVSEDLHGFLKEFDTRVVSGMSASPSPTRASTRFCSSAPGASRTSFCSSTTRSPTSAPPRRSAWARSITWRASISNASSRRAGSRCKGGRPKAVPRRRASAPSDCARWNEGAVEVNGVEHVGGVPSRPVGVRRRAITEVRTMGVVARRVAGDRQKGDALLRDRHPSLLASQEFELVATLAVGRRGAIVAAAAEKPIFALYAGIDVMGARAGERRREEGGAEGRPQNSSDHIRSS